MKLSPVQQHFVDARLCGSLTHNDPEGSRQSVREMLAFNPYWSLNIRRITDRPDSYDNSLKRLVEALGITMKEFETRAESYINPEETMARLGEAMDALVAAADKGDSIMFATGHPGSLLEPYRLLADYLRERGAVITTLPRPLRIESNHWLDVVGSVIVRSDEGSLLHTHGSEGLEELLPKLAPDWLVADHGFAAAAINAGIPTVGFFDVDDPGIPLSVTATNQLIAIPMNDNQTNAKTAAAFAKAIELYRG